MSDYRQSLFFIIVGTNGTGKTTLLNKLIAESGRKALIVEPDGFEWRDVKEIDDNYVKGTIIDSFSNYGESKLNVNLIIGLIKGRRMDMVFEKATELGVKSIQPLLVDHCIKNKLNLKRAEEIIISAAKQTGRSFFPKVYEPTNLQTWLLNHHEGSSFACHINGKKSINDLVDNDNSVINIIIGPEGDFSKQELNQFKEAKIELVNLSSRRLRSESAAIVSIANVIQIMEK